MAKQWDTSLKGHCIQTQPFYFALGGTSIALDFIIIALPLPVLWKLQLRTKQKVFLAALFALGFFVTIVQFIRIFTVKDLKTYTDSKNIVLWSLVEVSLGVSPLFIADLWSLRTASRKLNIETCSGRCLLHSHLRPAFQGVRIQYKLLSEPFVSARLDATRVSHCTGKFPPQKQVRYNSGPRRKYSDCDWIRERKDFEGYGQRRAYTLRG